MEESSYKEKMESKVAQAKSKIQFKTPKIVKEITTVLIMVFCLVMGFYISEQSYNLRHKQEKINPYSIIYTPIDISIAVNESNDLLIVEKKTGNYIMYNDSIGQTIFKMYANKIYQEHNVEKDIK